MADLRDHPTVQLILHLWNAEEVKIDFDAAMSHIKKYKETVWECLKTYPPARDSDLYLYYHILEMLGANPKLITAHDLLAGIAQDKYPNYDSVSRLRRMIQEVDADTRGPNYKPRADTEEAIQRELEEMQTSAGAG